MSSTARWIGSWTWGLQTRLGSSTTPTSTQAKVTYLAIIVELCSRSALSWSTQSRQTTDIVLQSLLMAVWRRKPQEKGPGASGSGIAITSMDWESFLKNQNLVHSTSRRRNCHDNAVAESFVNLMKRERIWQKSLSFPRRSPLNK